MHVLTAVGKRAAFPRWRDPSLLQRVLDEGHNGTVTWPGQSCDAHPAAAPRTRVADWDISPPSPDDALTSLSMARSDARATGRGPPTCGGRDSQISSFSPDGPRFPRACIQADLQLISFIHAGWGLPIPHTVAPSTSTSTHPTLPPFRVPPPADGQRRGTSTSQSYIVGHPPRACVDDREHPASLRRWPSHRPLLIDHLKTRRYAGFGRLLPFRPRPPR